MKFPFNASIAALVALLLAVSASADTIFNGGELFTSTDWTNGLPSSGNPGMIAVGGSANATSILWGGTVNQTAGDIVATGTNGVNLRSGTVWNMSGGSFTARYFNANGSTFNMSGGTVTIANVSGTKQIQTNGTGSWTISGSFTLDATHANGDPRLGSSSSYNFLTGWTGSWTQGNFSGPTSRSATGARPCRRHPPPR